MKALVFSDIHVHTHKRSTERLSDCLQVLEWVFQTAKDREIKHVLFLGDLFHERQQISTLTYWRVFEVFERNLSGTDIEIYCLLGNHDLWHHTKWDVSSVKPLRALPNVRVIDEPCMLDVAGFPVGFLPYTHDPIVDLERIEKDQKPEDLRLMCGHVAVDGALWNTMKSVKAEVSIEHDGDMIKVSPDIFHNWSKTLLGHYHAEQRMEYHVEYVGSPLQLSFGEAFQHKHIMVFDLETHKIDYLRNEFSPKHIVCPEVELHKFDLEGNFVRVLVDDISDSKLVDMKRNLTDTHKVGSLEIKQRATKEDDDKTIIEEAKAILYKEDEMLNAYIKAQEAKIDLDVGRLLTIGKDICRAHLE